MYSNSERVFKKTYIWKDRRLHFVDRIHRNSAIGACGTDHADDNSGLFPMTGGITRWGNTTLCDPITFLFLPNCVSIQFLA